MQAHSEPVTSVIDFIHARSAEFADRMALVAKSGDEWKGLTYLQLSTRARDLAAYLIGDVKLQHGDRIALLADSKPEWGIAFFCTVRSGAVLVPLDVKLTETELTNILSDCEPTVIFHDTKHAEVVENLKKKIGSLKHSFNIDSPEEIAKSTAPAASTSININDLKASDPAASRDRKMEEVALIVYTSGTTGNPKGVMTTFGNLIFQVSSFKEMVNLNESDRFLSLLPLNHLLELTGGFSGLLNQGGTINFCHSLFPQEIIKSMKERQITGMISVPLFFKSLKGAIEREIRKKGDEAVQRFAAGLQQADKLPMEQRRQIFNEVHQQFGGHLRVFIAGGAPLEVEVAQFFERLGIPVLQGYGLTETSPVISGNSLKANRLGSVGQALPGVELRIDRKEPTDEGGEIVTRGPHIMKGYYKHPEQTAEVIDKDGWFHTGDIGHIDKEGFLYITGRIKNLIVLGGGKKVFPEEVEAALTLGHTIKEICVVGRKSTDGFKEGTEEVCAVVVPSDAIVAELKTPEAVQQAVKKELDELGQNLATYKRPMRIFFYEGDMPKTATRKIKRPLVLEWLSKV